MRHEVMAALGADFDTSFMEKYPLKGFASMLLPVRRDGQSIFWHFMRTFDGKFLPYTAVKDVDFMAEVDFGDVTNCRLFWAGCQPLRSGQVSHRRRSFGLYESSTICFWPFT